MPDYWLAPEDFTICELLGGDVGVWEAPLPVEAGLRFSGNDMSAAMIFGFAERTLDEFE